MIMEEITTPWLGSYGEVPFHLEYSELSISDAVMQTAEREGDYPALSFMDRKISYKKLGKMIDKAARAFAAMGIKEDQKVVICMPNVPQAIYCMYGLNRIGAIPCMIHPLSAIGEIAFYLKEVDSRIIFTLDQFYHKIVEVEKQYSLDKVIISTGADGLDPVIAEISKLAQCRKVPRVRSKGNVIVWNDFLRLAKKAPEDYVVHRSKDQTAVILFSGGTTGTTKGIMLSSLNFNALALQTATMCHQEVHHSKMLAAMPIFHGFGLGVCIHTILYIGGTSILVPKFSPKEYAELIKKNKPNFIAGVPTLYQAISSNPYLDGESLDYLRGVFSGGDSLSVELKKKFDKFLDDHGSPVHVREGYGTTECVTASCLTPYTEEREGSIGLPYPDTYYKICKPESDEELPYGSEGEICLCGPSVMLGYLNKPEENAKTLVVHSDGHTWLHTGDLGVMDEDGFIYFKQRMKRMIITSGYNVYPSQLENIIDAHEAVRMSCVIGVKDPYKIQKVKAFVMLNEGYETSPELKADILNYCRQRIAKYAMPYDIEFREELPKTLVGKVAYKILENEEAEKQKANV